MANVYMGVAEISFNEGRSWIRVQATMKKRPSVAGQAVWEGIIAQIGAYRPWPKSGECIIRVTRIGAPMAKAHFLAVVHTTSKGRRQHAEIQGEGEAPF